MTINYYSKEVYGQTLYYLASKSERLMWQAVSGKKTITKTDMATMELLTGVTFNRVFEAEN